MCRGKKCAWNFQTVHSDKPSARMTHCFDIWIWVYWSFRLPDIIVTAWTHQFVGDVSPDGAISTCPISPAFFGLAPCAVPSSDSTYFVKYHFFFVFYMRKSVAFKTTSMYVTPWSPKAVIFPMRFASHANITFGAH